MNMTATWLTRNHNWKWMNHNHKRKISEWKHAFQIETKPKHVPRFISFYLCFSISPSLFSTPLSSPLLWFKLWALWAGNFYSLFICKKKIICIWDPMQSIFTEPQLPVGPLLIKQPWWIQCWLCHVQSRAPRNSWGDVVMSLPTAFGKPVSCCMDMGACGRTNTVLHLLCLNIDELVSMAQDPSKSHPSVRLYWSITLRPALGYNIV